MLSFVFRKMKNSRWMTASLLLGNLLLFSVVAAIPIYTDGIMQSVMSDSLAAIQASGEVWSGSIHTEANVRQSRAYKQTLRAGEITEDLAESYGVPILAQSHTRTSFEFRYELVSERTSMRSGRMIALSAKTGFADHIEIVGGRLYNEEISDGVIEAVINAETMARQDMMIGETYTFESLKDKDGVPYQFRVVGVFRGAEASDPYWYKSPDTEIRSAVISMQAFEQVFDEEYRSRYSMNMEYDYVIDTQQLDVAKVSDYAANTNEATEQIEELRSEVSIAFARTLNSFLGQQGQLNVLLWLLLVPILVMLALFLFMVSRQILEQEKNTIAVLKSRGASRTQVVGIYAAESFILCIVCGVVGIPWGLLLCRVIGASNGFLNLVSRTALPLRLVPDVFYYVAAAAALSVLMMTVPAVLYSRETIVSHKRAGAKSGVLSAAAMIVTAAALAVSLYGWYSFRNQVTAVIGGASAQIDPLLYMAASVFLLGSGAAVALLLPMVLRGLHRVGEKRWSAPVYAALLRAQRAATDQRFLMVFLVLTIAVGIFNATTARTINQNKEDNLTYRNGADMVLLQVWEDNSKDEAAEMRLYYEPDFGLYEQFDAEHEDLTLTKVLNRSRYTVKGTATRVMGIDSKAFGSVTEMRSDLLPAHYYDYLNALSLDAAAVLVSENYKADGYELGDDIEIVNENGVSMIGTIYGFIEYWPTYYATDIHTDYWGERTLVEERLIVGNLVQMQNIWGVEPYEIWIETDNTDLVYDFAAENGLQYTAFTDTAADLVDEKNDPILQGTNGVLTVGFILVLAVCMVGFLIFWILSIRSRTLQFGVFRAMGMPMRGLIALLIAEQVCVSLTSVAAGAGVGILASRLYVPLIQLSYTSMDITLPLRIVAEGSDYLRLFSVFGAVFVICLAALAILVKRIRIAQALKLGED
ncbi:MAG: ABC transporter permease [Ruminococcaceae bacterium]|nr:ABC transporter permease [Oscillospiraceae bacterium]